MPMNGSGEPLPAPNQANRTKNQVSLPSSFSSSRSFVIVVCVPSRQGPFNIWIKKVVHLDMFRHPISTPFAIPLPLLRSFRWKLRLVVVEKTWGPWWGPSYWIRACIALLMHLGFESQGSRGARGQEVGLTPPNLPRPNLLSHHIIVIFFSIWESLFVVCVLIFSPVVSIFAKLHSYHIKRKSSSPSSSSKHRSTLWCQPSVTIELLWATWPSPNLSSSSTSPRLSPWSSLDLDMYFRSLSLCACVWLGDQ